MTSYRLTPKRRLINVAATLAVRAGIGARHRYLLTVPGRRTGCRFTTPVGIVEHAGGRWLVAPYGEVAWVRNARAAGAMRLARGRRSERMAIEPATAEQAGAVLKRYLALEPITRPFFSARGDDPAEVFAAEAERHPVFRLAPAERMNADPT